MSDETLKKKPETESSKVLIIMAIIVLIVGLYLIFIAPILYDITTDRLISVKIKTNALGAKY